MKSIISQKRMTLKLKTIFMFSLIMFAYHTSPAQFNQGRMIAGGSVTFLSTTNKTTYSGSSSSYNVTYFSFAPQFGYFVVNRLAIGATIDLGTQKSSGSFSPSTTNTLQVGPFVRYYLKPGVFFQGKYGIGSIKRTTSGSPDVTETISSWSLLAGYAIFLNDHVAIEPLIGYQSTSYKEKDPDYEYTSAGLGISIGLQIYLGQKD